MVGRVSLPVTRASVNGFVISDCLLDSGSEKSLIDSKVLEIIAPNVSLQHTKTELVSASNHALKALGTCSLPVKIVTEDGQQEKHFDFYVVENLLHDCVLGTDFFLANRLLLDFSDTSGQVKIRLKKPIRIPPRSVSCISVRTDRDLSVDSDYVLTGRQSDQIEITDLLIRPFSNREIPLCVRNRSDRFVTLHRRDVVGYLQPSDGADVADIFPRDGDSDEMDATETLDTAETNAVSASDGQFLGMDSDEILSHFTVGDEVKGANREKVAKLVQSFPEVFSKDYSDIGCYTGGEVDLELTPDAKPWFSKPYPVPWAKEKALEQQLDALQDSGVIAVGEPSDWNSPVVLVPKTKDKGSEFRIVQDMRDINQSLLPKKFVLPNIDDFLFSLHGWKVASSLDIKHAFWNLKLGKASQNICAFHALGKTYYPQRMPMGCAQSSFFLHKAIHRVLGDIPGVSVYADDVLLVSPDMESHMKLLHTVLCRLSRAGFKLSPHKCHIGMNKLSYLGHEITPEGVTIEADRIRCIEELKAPTTLKEAKRIYGFFAWFRKFIPSFSSISAPLVQLANAETFYWDDELDQAFSLLRRHLLSGRILAYPTRDDPFVLYTDSSTVGSGQILCQIQHGVEKVIAFNGAKYSRAQSKWTIYELEVFSYITGLKKFYKYLAGAEFKWICDCKSALKILQSKEEANPRIIRWRAYVSQFNFQTEHRPAASMQHVDMISRIPESQPETENEERSVDNVSSDPVPVCASTGSSATLGSSEASVPRAETQLPRPRAEPAEGAGARRSVSAGDTSAMAGTEASHHTDREARVNLVAGPSLAKLDLDRESIVWYQKHDKDCRALAHYIKYQKWPKFCSPSLKRHPVENFILQDRIICHKDSRSGALKVVWPRAKRFELLYEHHDPSHHAHCGHEKLYEKVSRYVWYIGLKADCKNYVDSCTRCSQRKDDRGPPAPPLLPQDPCGPGDVLVIDIVHMPRSRLSGKTLVMTCIDKFTGYLTHYPLQTGTADGIADALSTHFLTFGPPQRLETDAGANFKSQKVQELCKFWGISIRNAVGAHHEAIGKVERRHHDIKRRLRTLTENYGADWENHLLPVIFSLNNETSESHGYSPYFLYFMRHMNSPISQLTSRPVPRYSYDFVHEKLRLLADTLKKAHGRLRLTQADMKHSYDLRHRVREPSIRPGDRVRLRSFDGPPGVSRKMASPWSEAYVVLNRLSRRHVELLDPRTGKTRRTHIKFVKPVVDREV